MLEKQVKQAKLDPRVKRTRQLLQNALTELIAEKDFPNVTVQDIAELAGVNRATFYAHFEDKYALLNYSLRETLQTLLESKLPDSPTFSPDSLRSLTLTLCEFLGQFLGHCGTHTHSNEQLLMMSQVQSYTSEVILTWITDAGSIQASIMPETLAQATSWTIFGCVFHWATTGRHLAPEDLADQVLALLTSGIAPHLVREAGKTKRQLVS